MKPPTRGRRPAHPASSLPPGTTGGARRRLIQAQAERIEAQNRVRAGELLEVAAVEAIWREILATVRATLLALPTGLAAGLVALIRASTEGAERRVEALLRDRIEGALQELSTWRPPAPANQPETHPERRPT